MKVLYFIILFSIPVYCQGEYLAKDEFGIGVGYSISGSEKSSVSGIDGVITILGIVDVGVQHANGEHDYEYSSQDLKSSGTILYLAYIIKKRDNNINLKFLLGYYTGSVSRSSGHGSTSEGVVAGIGFYPRLVNGVQFQMRLTLELIYGFLSTSDNSGYYSNDSNYDDTRSIAAGLSFLLGVSENFHLVLSPFLSKDLIQSSSSVEVGVNGRLLLSFSKAK